MKSKFSLQKMLMFFGLFLSSITISSQTIKSGVFGQNAWYIDVQNFQIPPDDIWEKVAKSGVKWVRIGGIQPNFFPFYDWNSSFMINTSQRYPSGQPHLFC
jgi:hypothetical protein